MTDYTGGSAVGAVGGTLAATGAASSQGLVLFVGALLMGGALLMFGVSAHRRRQDRQAARS